MKKGVFLAVTILFLLLSLMACAEQVAPETFTFTVPATKTTVHTAKTYMDTVQSIHKNATQHPFVYPVFSAEDPTLTQTLTALITEDILSTRQTFVDEDNKVFTVGNTIIDTYQNTADYYGNYDIQLIHDRFLQVKQSFNSTVTTETGKQDNWMNYYLIDLQTMRRLSLYDLYTESAPTVNQEIFAAFAKTPGTRYGFDHSDEEPVLQAYSFYIDDKALMVRDQFSRGDYWMDIIDINERHPQLTPSEIYTALF